MANKYRKEDTGELRSYLDQRSGKDVVEKVQIAIPVSGTFLAISNWAQLADSFEGVVGISADGSLWRFNTFGSDATDSLAYLSRVPQLERVGEDSDWKMVVGLGGAFALLKQDGSIWTWMRSQAPARFGHDSDWTAIFAGQYGFVGVKGDGSVWGNVQNDASPNLSNGDRVQWVKIYPAGSDWATVEHYRNFDLLIKHDGTLWACGHLPESILGKMVNTHGPDSRFAVQPIQIGLSADFADIKSEWGSCVVLTKAGAIYAEDFSDWHLALWGSARKLSENSDWIAIASAMWNRPDIALASDGTLSAWEKPLRRSYSGQLLGPSRKPLWTLNIFDEGK